MICGRISKSTLVSAKTYEFIEIAIIRYHVNIIIIIIIVSY